MNRKKIILSIKLLLFYFVNSAFSSSNFDLTVVSRVVFADGLGRIAVQLIDNLKDDININFIPTNSDVLPITDIPAHVTKIMNGEDKTPGNISILMDQLWRINETPASCVPESKIKLAYSMTETSAILDEWVKILNNSFDAVIVPDKSLIKVYQNSGVKIPIFNLPIALYLDDFLNSNLNFDKTNFVFGVSAQFVPHKNQLALIEAFAQEFGNQPNIKLKIHGRMAIDWYLKMIQDKINELKITNVEIICKSFTQNEYISFMKSLNCYVLISKGEGFSISPREALALGIPCILTDNSAHHTICKTGYVRAIPCNILEPSYYSQYFQGYHQNCEIKDIRQALQDVYTNYEYYLDKAATAKKNWVGKYNLKNLKNKYLTLFKPQKIFLGKKNKIKNDYIETNSYKLYQKYLNIMK